MNYSIKNKEVFIRSYDTLAKFGVLAPNSNQCGSNVSNPVLLIYQNNELFICEGKYLFKTSINKLRKNKFFRWKSFMLIIFRNTNNLRIKDFPCLKISFVTAWPIEPAPPRTRKREFDTSFFSLSSVPLLLLLSLHFPITLFFSCHIFCSS